MSARLDIQSVAKSLGGRPVLDNISLAAEAGDFIGLVGPNGAGKSTLLRIIAALDKPDAGAVLLDNGNAQVLPPIERARRISYLPQLREIAWGLSAREIAALGRFAFGAPLVEDDRDAQAVMRALEEAGAAAFADRLANTLSGGERARVHLARALAGETPLLLADEPIAALDPAHQLSVMALLRAKADAGRVVIAALHELPLAARYCTRLIVLYEGRIAFDGAPNAIPAPTIAEAFNIAAEFDADGRLVAIAPL